MSASHIALRISRNTRAFTMIELLVVLAILSILMVLALISAPGYLSKANDARRKSDLAAYKVAFEHYYEDYHCYPPISAMSLCGSSTLQPYLPRVMCDPVKNKPYTYETNGANGCSSFKIFSKLINVNDPDIIRIGCENGCGPSGSTEFNYGVSSDNVRVGNPVTGTNPDSAGSGTTTNDGSHVTPECALQPDGTWNCVCNPGSSCGLGGCPGSTICSNDGLYCYTDLNQCPLGG